MCDSICSSSHFRNAGPSRLRSSFAVKTPTTASLLTRAAGLEKGAAHPNGVAVGTISREQLYEIARVKLPDLDAHDVNAAARTIAGTARSMGIAITDE